MQRKPPDRGGLEPLGAIAGRLRLPGMLPDHPERLRKPLPEPLPQPLPNAQRTLSERSARAMPEQCPSNANASPAPSQEPTNGAHGKPQEQRDKRRKRKPGPSGLGLKGPQARGLDALDLIRRGGFEEQALALVLLRRLTGSPVSVRPLAAALGHSMKVAHRFLDLWDGSEESGNPNPRWITRNLPALVERWQSGNSLLGEREKDATAMQNGNNWERNGNTERAYTKRQSGRIGEHIDHRASKPTLHPADPPFYRPKVKPVGSEFLAAGENLENDLEKTGTGGEK